MDFLRIRQKAKERAPGGAAPRPPPAGPQAGLRPAPEPAPPAARALAPALAVPLRQEAPVAPPAVTAADLERIEDALRAELAAAALAHGAAPDARRELPADPLDDFFWREDEEAPGVLALAEPVIRRRADAPEARREWLTFRLGQEDYGIEIAHVREILKAPVITEVPRAPAHVLGVIMVRGEVIAVFDPRRRLGLTPATPGPRARVVVCDAGEGPRGLLVDGVSQVVRLPASALEVRPGGVGGVSADCIAALGRERDQLYILLDLPALLHDHAGPRAEGAP
jgi:purine-binding chemotaxis protein CheW